MIRVRWMQASEDRKVATARGGGPETRGAERGRCAPTGIALTVSALVLLSVSSALAQTNFLSLNNGSESFLMPPGTTSSGTNPNLYYRCFDRDILYAPQGAGLAGLDVTGFQLIILNRFPMIGYPLIYFVEDPSLSCILSAAIGGGFPPNASKIISSPNTRLAMSFYTPTASPFPSPGGSAFRDRPGAFRHRIRRAAEGISSRGGRIRSRPRPPITPLPSSPMTRSPRERAAPT